jgi:hypothetical protein
MSNVDGGRMMELNDVLLLSRIAIRTSTFAIVRSPWTTARRIDKKKEERGEIHSSFLIFFSLFFKLSHCAY